jgi:hypothetical protein
MVMGLPSETNIEQQTAFILVNGTCSELHPMGFFGISGSVTRELVSWLVS